MSERITASLSRIHTNIDQILEITGCAGASVGVVHNHKIIWRDNFGHADVEARSRPTSDTIYGIGSLTKGIVAGAIASLVAEGKLTSETPIKDILPSFSHHVEEVEKGLTVLDLLSHRSGLSGFAALGMAFAGDGEMLLDEDQLFTVFHDLPQDEPLRSSWNYLVWGYSLLGTVVAQVTERPLHECLDNTIFRPLGMHSTTVEILSFLDTARVAKPYAALSNAQPFALPHRQRFEGTFFEASGGVYSTVNDMLAWSKELLTQVDETATQDKPEPRLPNLKDTMSNCITIDSSSGGSSNYAMGWVRTQLPAVVGLIGDACDVWEYEEENPIFSTGPESRQLVYHQGATVGYYSCLFLFPETGTAVVVLTNTAALGDAADWIARITAEAVFPKPERTNYQELARRYRDDHLQKYVDFQRQIDAGRDTSAQPQSLDVYVGRYHHGRLRYFIDILRDSEHSDGLLLRFQGHELQTYQLRHYHHDVFEWSMSRDEAVRRGRYHCWDPAYFQMQFVAWSSGKSSELLWRIDCDAAAPEAFVREAVE